MRATGLEHCLNLIGDYIVSQIRHLQIQTSHYAIDVKMSVRIDNFFAENALVVREGPRHLVTLTPRWDRSPKSSETGQRLARYAASLADSLFRVVERILQGRHQPFLDGDDIITTVGDFSGKLYPLPRYEIAGAPAAISCRPFKQCHPVREAY